jgi:hypothetical protein
MTWSKTTWNKANRGWCQSQFKHLQASVVYGLYCGLKKVHWSLNLQHLQIWLYLEIQLSPFSGDFVFHNLSYSQSIVVQWYLMENSRNKQFINFKLCAVLEALWNQMQSYSVLPRTWLIPLSSISTLYEIPVCQSLDSCPGYQINCHDIIVLMF